MKFIIAINEAEEKDDGTKGTVTFDHVETDSFCKRTNKRKLHAYLGARGVPKKYIKSTMKALGFVDSELGMTASEREKLTQKRAYLKTIKA